MNEIISISLDRKRIVFYDLCSSAPRKISGSSSSPFTKELAHPPKKQKDEEASDEEGGGFAEGYGDVDSAELSALLAADEEFNASLDLSKIVAEDELNRYELHVYRIKVCNGEMALFFPEVRQLPRRKNRQLSAPNRSRTIVDGKDSSRRRNLDLWLISKLLPKTRIFQYLRHKGISICRYRPKISKTTIDLPIEEEVSDSAEASEKAESNAGVALLSAAIAQVDEIQPKTLDISAE